ncbi:hypothetical protein niasHT_029967 [Heterodera trifolii]|uniref:Protein kinase domain-containing protein n=1 Tax=Heterodera trifolii TaxID=157864 RepID=A0ABD2JVL8_9BILA
MGTLVEFHQVGIHLDFKPQNVIVVESIEKVKSFKLIDFDASIVYLDKHKKGEGTKKSLHYTDRFAAPELFKALTSKDPPFVEVTPKMDIWPAGITIFQMVFSKVRHFNSPFHKMVAVELFCCAKLKPDEELLSRIKNLELQEVNGQVGSVEWWKTYWQMIGDILTVWHEMPEIVFLSKNMLSIEPQKRMSAKGVIDYLEGKCKPKEFEKYAKKIALFGDVSAEKLREMMKMEEFNSFFEFIKNKITEERKVRGQSEKKEKGEKKEKEKMRSEKDFEKLENIKKKLVKEVEKSVKLMLKDMNKRKEFCDH